MADFLSYIAPVVGFVGIKGAAFFAAGFAVDRWALPAASAGLSKLADWIRPTPKG